MHEYSTISHLTIVSRARTALSAYVPQRRENAWEALRRIALLLAAGATGRQCDAVGRSGQRLDEEAPVVDLSSVLPETLGAFVRTNTNTHGHPEELSMQKFFQSGYAFVLAALLFLVVGVASDRPAVYISLGAVILILALATRKRNAQKAQQTTDPSH